MPFSIIMPVKKLYVKFFLPSVLILGAVIRLLFLFTPNLDSDQAVTGLIRIHIGSKEKK